MKPATKSSAPSLRHLAVLGMSLTLAAASLAAGQPGPPGGPGSAAGSGDVLAFEVRSIDTERWIVTARELESGDEFRFRLPPEAFRGQRFQADLSGARAGGKVTVAGQPDARLHQVSVEMPLGKVRGPESDPGERWPGSGETGPDRYAPPKGAGEPGNRYAPDTSRFSDRSVPGQRPGGPAGPSGYEVLSVDAGSWTVTVRGENGDTVSLEIDPQAFVGYRFRASVKNLRAGEGFELLADNERPLADCCTVKDLPRR